jgi:bifunctional NMN adenylyltransferase/nudix hydrolase
MMPEFDYLVFVGRFQPLHNGHVHIINEALKRTDKLIILIGSSNQAPSPRNPFTFEQRAEMIRRTIERKEIKAAAGQIIIEPLRDTPYNDRAWIVNVQKTVERVVVEHHKGGEAPRIGLTGFKKDSTS